MPYYFDTLQTPLNDKHFWERIEEMWTILEGDLRRTRFETEEEALSGKYRNSLDPDDMRVDSMFVARFRESDDRENLDHFRDRGLKAAYAVEKLILRRKVTVKLIEQWSIMVSCHGFMTASVMARGNDAHRRRAGKAGGAAVANVFKEQQQQWFAHYFLQGYEGRGSRARTEDRVEKLVNDIVTGSIAVPNGTNLEFFEGMLQAGGKRGARHLKSYFRDTKLSVPTMRKLVTKSSRGLPLLRKLLPLPKVKRS